MKFSTEEIQQTLESTIDASDAQKILRKLEQLKISLKEEKDLAKETKPKWETVILQREGTYSDITEIPSVVLQIPEGTNHNLVPSMIQKAYDDYRSEKTKKKGKMKIDSIFLAIEHLPKKYLKANNIKVVKNSLTLIVTTNNILNTQEKSF